MNELATRTIVKYSVASAMQWSRARESRDHELLLSIGWSLFVLQYYKVIWLATTLALL